MAVAVEHIPDAIFTCMSCSIAFNSGEDQRAHYRSDHHRYNMKRRVAGLPPVSPSVFDQKVLERRAETAVMLSPKGSLCEVCGKSYTTENAYRSHLISKKHKENELKAARTPKVATAEKTASSEKPNLVPPQNAPVASTSTTALRNEVTEEDEEDVEASIDAKIAAARSRLSPNACLFCPHASGSMDANISHMATSHSFFIPELEYLTDLPGLLAYLGEKLAVGNTCLYCPASFRTLEAVRAHMLDRSHQKLAYDSERERLEISDYYDFTTSYPDAAQRQRRREKSKIKPRSLPADDEADEDGEWEDVSDDGSVDEIVDAPSDFESDTSLPDDEVTYGDSPYELVLPSGARIGHRSLKRYYAQSFRPLPARHDPKSGAAIVQKLLADKNLALVPAKGAFGAFGGGTQVVKARNAGEAQEAGRHVKEFRDQARREAFKTKVGFRHNHQKHFRDPLLQ